MEKLNMSFSYARQGHNVVKVIKINISSIFFPSSGITFARNVLFSWTKFPKQFSSEFVKETFEKINERKRCWAGYKRQKYKYKCQN